MLLNYFNKKSTFVKYFKNISSIDYLLDICYHFKKEVL